MNEFGLHATAVLIADRGVLIEGRSGAGKTTLALRLIEQARLLGHFARLVSDDHVRLHVVGERLVATVPDSIAGQVEIYGIGPQPACCEPRCIVDLIVSLVQSDQALRYQDMAFRNLGDAKVATLSLAERHSRAASNAILAHLGVGNFGKLRQNG